MEENKGVSEVFPRSSTGISQGKHLETKWKISAISKNRRNRKLEEKGGKIKQFSIIYDWLTIESTPSTTEYVVDDAGDRKILGQLAPTWQTTSFTLDLAHSLFFVSTQKLIKPKIQQKIRYKAKKL